MKNKLISNFSFIVLMVSIICSSFFGVGIYCLIRVSAIDSWFSVIISSLFCILIASLFIFVSSYEPDLSIRDKIIKLYGKKVGFIFNLIICILFFLVGVNYMYNLNSFIVSQYLSETPLVVIGISFVFLITYINIKNIECISRTCIILSYIIILFITLTFFNLIPKIDIDNFKPIFKDGLKDSIIGSLYIISMNFSVSFLLLIIPKNKIQDEKKYKKNVIMSYIISIMLMLITIVIIIGNLGIYLASYYQYPEYMVLKRIKLFSFLNRLENIFIISWIFMIFSTLTLIVYYISNTIKYNNRSKVLPVIIISSILYCSLHFFKNSTTYNNYNYTITPYVRSLIIILFIIISLSILIKKKINHKKRK